MRLRFVVPITGLVGLLATAFVRDAAALTLDRDVRIDPARVSLSAAKGVTFVEARGGTHEYTAGRPDLPWISERVDLPAGMRITGVEVGDVGTQGLADGVGVAPSASARPGAEGRERLLAPAQR